MVIKGKMTAVLSLVAATAVACGQSETKSTPETTTATDGGSTDGATDGETDGGEELNAITGALSLNLVPSLSEAAGAGGAALLLAPSGNAPSFAQLQEQYLTKSSKEGLFGTGQSANFACQAVNKTARAISKFLSTDSELCMFKEVSKGLKANKSWISLTAGTVGEEGLFGQLSADKKVKVSVPMSEGTMTVLFDIKGSGGDANSGYELKMRMCEGDKLSSLQVVGIDRVTGKITVTQNKENEEFYDPKEAGKKEDKFVGYMKKGGGGWDLAQDREFSYDMFGDNQYEALVAKFTKEGQIVTAETRVAANGPSPGTFVSHNASTVKGSNAVNIALSENYFKRNDNSNLTTGGMEFVDSKYQSAESSVLKAIVDALPTTGRYYQRPDSYSLPLLEGANCTMESPDVEATLNLQSAEAEIDTVCKTILTDSSEETVNGNPVVRSGSYCNDI